jgi:hypothetical protein
VTLVRLLTCIALFALLLCLHLDKQNRITQLRYELPMLADRLEGLREQNAILQYEIDRLESPVRLMHLLALPEYSHLKDPELSDIIWVPLPPGGVCDQTDTRR